jgi:hypothetical protein
VKSSFKINVKASPECHVNKRIYLNEEKANSRSGVGVTSQRLLFSFLLSSRQSGGDTVMCWVRYILSCCLGSNRKAVCGDDERLTWPGRNN